MPQSESELQLISRKNDVAVAGGATDASASTSADRPLSPSEDVLASTGLYNAAIVWVRNVDQMHKEGTPDE